MSLLKWNLRLRCFLFPLLNHWVTLVKAILQKLMRNADKFESQKVILAHFTLSNSMWCLRRCLFSLKNDVRIEEAYLLRQLVLPWWKLIWSDIGESTANWSTSSPIMETFTKKLGPILTFHIGVIIWIYEWILRTPWNGNETTSCYPEMKNKWNMQKRNQNSWVFIFLS